MYRDPDMIFMMPILIMYVVVFAIMGIGGLASFVLRGLGLYEISKKQGKKNGWMGFVPILWRWQYGSLAGELSLGRRTVRTPGMWMLLIPIVRGFAITGGYLLFVLVLFAQVIPAAIADAETPPAGIFVSMFLFWAGLVLVMIVFNTLYYGLLGLVNVKLFERYLSRDAALVQMLLCLFVPLYQSIYLFILGGRYPIGMTPPSVQAAWNIPETQNPPV